MKEEDLIQLRRKLWCDVYVAYVSAANATDMDGGYKWANIALLRFDEKFPHLETLNK